MKIDNRRGESAPSAPERELAARTRRAFLTLGVAAAAGYGGWEWLRTRPEEDGSARPFRRMLQFNERIAGKYYDESHLAPTFPAARVQKMRTNGDIGLGDDFDPGTWHLTVNHLTEPHQLRRLNLADIQALPKREHITRLQCIEGWSVVTHWAGTRFADFTAHFAPESARARFVSLQTPDDGYFVGLDMPSAMHPQTLLCYEMNGAPLAMEHGAPLRLFTPVKYGIKSIKRVGAISYTDKRPRDYWAEEGYDWYAGL
ncbi:MAG: molybdopterin-dependent oxidoreductase [Bryobacteraceae bacterium]